MDCCSKLHFQPSCQRGPCAHTILLDRILLAPILEGVPTVVLPKFTPETFFNAVSKYRVTLGMVVPPILIHLAQNPLVEKYDLTSLRMLMSAAAPLGKGLTLRVIERLTKLGGEKAKGLAVTQGYGLTETTGVATALKPGLSLAKSGSIGTPYPVLQARLIDLDGNDVPKGQVGELCMKGTTIMRGYWNNERATRETFIEGQPGWLKTGDSAQIDEDGFI